MTLIQGDHMIEALSPQGADKSLNVRILPKAPWRTENLLDAHRVKPLSKLPAVDRIAIA
jgi:hypothetical protein